MVVGTDTGPLAPALAALLMGLALRRLSLWLSVPAVFCILVLLVVCAALMHLSGAEAGGRGRFRHLELQVPAGCTGAVRRVLSSSHFYEVPVPLLQLPPKEAVHAL
jgi:hypothetical protein